MRLGSGRRGAVAWIVERAQSFQPHLKSSNPDGDRASKLQHAVQDMDGDGNLGGAAVVRAKAQAVADHLLEPPNRGFNSGALVVAGSLLPTDASLLGDAPRMTVALRRICLGGLALDRRRSRGYDDSGIRIAATAAYTSLLS